MLTRESSMLSMSYIRNAPSSSNDTPCAPQFHRHTLVSLADASSILFGPDPLTQLVDRIRRSTAKEIEAFTAEHTSSISESRSSESAAELREKLQKRSQRVSTFNPCSIDGFCSSFASDPSLDRTQLSVCRIVRENDEPYNFSIRRQGKCMYFDKPPTEWESGMLPDAGDRLLAVNGTRTDNIKMHDVIFNELTNDELTLHFGKCWDFPDQEAYVLVPVVLHRTNEALGVSFRMIKQWLVFDLIGDGVFRTWNTSNPDLRIRPFDRLLSVNGISGYGETSHGGAMKELDSAECLHLFVAKLKTNPDPYNSFILFDVVVEREGGAIGLCVKRRGPWLVVRTIHEGALRNAIDSRPSAMAASEGDLIVMLNGIPGDETNQKKLISEMETAATLRFTFAKRPS